MPSLYIVEDNTAYLKYLETYYSNHKNFDVVTFQNGEECLASIKKSEPDYIILDYYLNEENPGAMNGWDVFDKISACCDKTKVIMLSAQQNGELVLELIRDGVRDYVIKGENTLNELDSIIHAYEQQEAKAL